MLCAHISHNFVDFAGFFVGGGWDGAHFTIFAPGAK